MAPNEALPLARYKILDLTRARAGPTCVRQLADWGADVDQDRAPARPIGDGMGGERHGPDFQNLHRNKRSMTLNLKAPEGWRSSSGWWRRPTWWWRTTGPT